METSWLTLQYSGASKGHMRFWICCMLISSFKCYNRKLFQDPHSNGDSKNERVVNLGVGR